MEPKFKVGDYVHQKKFTGKDIEELTALITEIKDNQYKFLFKDNSGDYRDIEETNKMYILNKRRIWDNQLKDLLK